MSTEIEITQFPDGFRLKVNNRADKRWLFDGVGWDKNFKHEWVHEWMQNMDCLPQIGTCVP